MLNSPDQLQYFIDKDQDRRWIGIPEAGTLEEQKNETYSRLISPEGLSVSIVRQQGKNARTLPLNFRFTSGSSSQLNIFSSGKKIAELWCQSWTKDGRAYKFEKEYVDDDTRQEYQNQGIMQFATSIFLFCLDRLGFTHLEGIVRPTNVASMSSRDKIPTIFDLTFETRREEENVQGHFVLPNGKTASSDRYYLYTTYIKRVKSET